MVNITNGSNTLSVTYGAYESFFKPLGYKPVGDARTPENPGQVNTPADPDSHESGDAGASSVGDTEPPETDSETSDSDEPEVEDEEINLSEIPLGEMTLSQLIAYAEQLGLDPDVNSSKKDLRKLIRTHLNQQ